MQRNMVKPTITFSCNPNYIGYAKTLINSIKQNSPNCDIYMRAVNFSQEQLFDIWSTGMTIISDNTKLSNEKNKIKNIEDNSTSFWKGDIPKRSLLYSEEISYTCHSRFKNVIDLLNMGTDNIFCVDVDFIIRRDLSELCGLGNDIHIKHGEEFRDEDAMFIKNTEESKKFFLDVHDMVNSNFGFWDMDTIALNEIYKKYKDDIKLHQLDMKYKDFNLSDESYVWSGDGGAKFTEKFIVESGKYL